MSITQRLGKKVIYGWTLTSEKGIIHDVMWVAMEPEDPLAKFEISSRVAKVNAMHPFFANFSEEVKTILPFQLIATTEILTEAYLIELGLDEDIIRNVMLRRDSILRELTFSDRPNTPVVAQLIQDSLADSVGLEDALFNAFNSLGFETTKLGGKGKPDGKAVAILGYGKDRRDSNYSFVYDAKSTKKDRIQAGTAKISTSVRHRNDYKADYSMVVARDFEGAEDPESAVSKEAKNHKVCLIRANDLIKLMLYSAPKQIGLSEIEDLLKNCHTVIETKEWIEKIKEKKIHKGPIVELLETTYKLQKEDTEPPIIAALRMENSELRKLSIDEIKTLIQSLKRLVPGYINIEGDIVSIEVPPRKVLEAINIVTTEVPPDFRNLYLEFFEKNRIQIN